MSIFGSSTSESIKIALRAIRGQLLRTIITVTIIAFGIMALIVLNTIAEAMESKIATEFSVLGSNTFQVYAKHSRSHGRQQGIEQKSYDPFDYVQARRFADEYDFDALVSVSAMGSGMGLIKYGSKKTNPNVQVMGGDANYLPLSGYEVASGRNFSLTDIENGANVVILGADVVAKLFEEFENPLDKEVFVGSYRYVVIGVLQSKGTSLGFATDNNTFIPISNLKKNFATKSTNYSINVQVKDPSDMEQAISEAYGVLRVVRGDKLGQEESFEIEKSDSLVETLSEAKGVITVGILAIGLITLFAAGIGLMNIMLVSVTERTREIGVRKAIGASAATIRKQFLIEATVLGQLGGLIGIVIGILVGNAIGSLLEAEFIIPWLWIVVGVTLCLITSMASGYYPARKAAELDPIESLRYE
jgi:putative ABC transport system permease protein